MTQKLYPSACCIAVLAVLLLSGCRSFGIGSPTVYLIGDSTAANKQEDKRPETGWGEMLGEYFRSGVEIENHARNGRSSKSFRDEGLWEAVRSEIERGDYVFIQFGHNDGKPDTARYSAPAAYGENLRRYIEETQERGGRAVVLGPIVRRHFDEAGVLQRTHGEYPATAERIAREMNVPFIDMTGLSREVVTELGDPESKKLYLWVAEGENDNYPDGVEDNTHFSPEGARTMAGLVARAIAEQQIPLQQHLRPTVTNNRR
ncbi:lysophospholipase L1-like esterase [Neolewinella xylanilytica]|uniref:Lysophospholipase L1-like esterase n=1 Tax=Neolewinella xylanilytica TaxID=1514080 RepID=A0A2S6IB74_9BACT|nr:rhamnogalacturonan acetylesterase [Neolewinella xylanilytica]PPK88748.1 lysophospholipase L1-like esterase [Neolewinella xylanilytica]